MPWNCTQGHGNADDANFCPKCGEGKPRPLTTADLEMVLQRLLQTQQGGQQPPPQQPAQPTPPPQQIRPRFPQRQQPEPEEEDEDYNPRQPQARRQAEQQRQPAPQPLSITTQNLPPGQQGMAYSQTLAASGGNTPHGWTLTGNLPAGMTHTNGQLSGTPTSHGTFGLIVSVRDTTGTEVHRPLTLVVNPTTPPTPPPPAHVRKDNSPRGVWKRVWNAFSMGPDDNGGHH